MLMKPLFIGCVLLSLLFIGGCSSPNIPQGDDFRDFEKSVTEKDLDLCVQDKDCIIVPHNHCCGSTKKAVNRDYLDIYNSHPEWQKFDDGYVCARIGICPDDSNVNSARCEDARCVLVY